MRIQPKKIQPRLAAAMAALLIISNIVPVFTVNAGRLPEQAIMTPDNASSPNEASPKAVTADDPVLPLPGEAPDFSASIEYSHQGYIVQGTFTEFPSDVNLVQPLYSLDGEDYQPCGVNWDLHWLNIDDAQHKLQTQTCLYGSQEPLKSYLAGGLDRFYLKLRILRENGLAYETQAAMIDRGDPQPLPETLTPIVKFAPSMIAREMRPLRIYGKYQLTIRADSSSEDISAYLPDTLPIEIQLQQGIHHVTEGTIDCPVTWKPLVLSQLTAGETILIPDAAEEIVIPGGTLLKTPKGVFKLDEPLNMSTEYGLTGEVRLFLNVIPENGEPTGVLSCENSGLEMAFQLKPTGATAIQAYAYTEGSSEWTKLPDIPLFAVNAQPSTANSGYVPVISNDMEPYRSYLEAKNSGNPPAPFFIGLIIEGGVFNGQQLVLAWPNTYDLPLDLPRVGGSGGNENNAGADNKDDSTSEGQRPNLPQDPGNLSKQQQLYPPQNPGNHLEEHNSDLPQTLKNKQKNNSRISHKPQHINQILYRLISQAAKTGTIKDTGTCLLPSDTAVQVETGADSKVNYSVNANTAAHTKIALPDILPTETETSAAPAISGDEETPGMLKNPDRKTDISRRTSFPPILAVLCIFGGCIFAAAGKVTAKNKSVRMIHRISDTLHRLPPLR